MDHPDDNSIEARARRRVGMKIGFYVHAMVFVLVNSALYLVNSITGSGRWYVFPLWGWGLGLAIHGLVTLVALQGDGIRDRMVREEIERLRKRDEVR